MAPKVGVVAAKPAHGAAGSEGQPYFFLGNFTRLMTYSLGEILVTYRHDIGAADMT